MIHRSDQGLVRTFRTVLLIMGAVGVAQAFGRFTWGIVLPEARDGVLGGSNTTAGLLGTANLAAYLVGTQLVVVASGRWTPERLIRVGLVLVTGGLAVASVARSGPMVGAALVMMGLGGAAIWIPAPALVGRALPPGRIGLGTGLVGTAIGAGTVLASLLAAGLRRTGVAEAWQAVYRIELVVAAIALVAAFTLLKDDSARTAATGPRNVLAALRSMDGWVPLTLAYGAFGFSYILVYTFFAARLQDDVGFTPGRAAAMVSVVGIASVFGGVLLGQLSDRIGRRVTLVGSFGACAGCTLLALSPHQPWVSIAAIGFGLTALGIPSMISAHVVANTRPESYSAVFSTVTLAFGLGQMLSPQIGGILADRLGSFTAVFLLSGAVALAGTAAVLRLPRAPTSM